MEEKWKEIPGYEGIYEISDKGNVRSLHFAETKGAIIRKQAENRRGYSYVILYKDGKGKCKTVHRLVATAFIENPLNLPEVNHKDENKQNNEESNLEWCDKKYNVRYGTAIERGRKARRKVVVQMSLSGHFIRAWDSSAECANNGFCKASIMRCCRGERRTHMGYAWKYQSKSEQAEAALKGSGEHE